MAAECLQICEQPATVSWQTVVATIAALTALVSAVVGPMIALKIARIQATLSVNVSEHKEWLQKLQNDLAEYLGILFEMTVLNGRDQRKGRTVEELNASLAEFEALTSHATRLSTLIDLRLDDNVPEHKELRDLLLASAEPITNTLDEGPPQEMFRYLANLQDVSRRLISIEIKKLRGEIKK